MTTIASCKNLLCKYKKKNEVASLSFYKTIIIKNSKYNDKNIGKQPTPLLNTKSQILHLIKWCNELRPYSFRQKEIIYYKLAFLKWFLI